MLRYWEDVWVVIRNLNELGIEPLSACAGQDVLGITPYVILSFDDMQKFVGTNTEGLTGKTTPGGVQWTKVVTLPNGDRVEVVASQEAKPSVSVSVEHFHA